MVDLQRTSLLRYNFCNRTYQYWMLDLCSYDSISAFFNSKIMAARSYQLSWQCVYVEICLIVPSKPLHQSLFDPFVKFYLVLI